MTRVAGEGRGGSGVWKEGSQQDDLLGGFWKLCSATMLG